MRLPSGQVQDRPVTRESDHEKHCGRNRNPESNNFSHQQEMRSSEFNEVNPTSKSNLFLF